jgi:hypothetical protein
VAPADESWLPRRRAPARSRRGLANGEQASRGVEGCLGERRRRVVVGPERGGMWVGFGGLDLVSFLAVKSRPITFSRNDMLQIQK